MTILFNACRPVNPRKPFGLGIARPSRVKLSPYASADLAFSASSPCPTAPTDAECRDEFHARTMNASEYRAFRDEISAAHADRYRRAEVQELAELGRIVTDAEWDRMAEEDRIGDLMGRGVVHC